MINGILAAEEWLASRVAHTVHRYPRQITGAIAALLMCAGGGAFAVASLGPDTNQWPVRQVLESAEPLPVEAQLDALQDHHLTLFRSELTRSSDTAEALLQRLGLDDPAAAAFIRGNAQARSALFDRAGRTVMAEASDDNQLQKLSVRWIPVADGSFKRLVVQRTHAGFQARIEADAPTPSSKLASGEVRGSLLAATDAAGVPDTVTSQLIDIFSDAVDLRRLRRGDRFAVVYETFEADGQTLRTGRVLSAEIESGGRRFQALWFQEPGQKGGYYRPDGQSLRNAYLASPVEHSHVTSGFAMRDDPIFHRWHRHNGIDFAAPMGEPVRAVGDGTVEFAGWQNGYGNIVILRHNATQETAYAHLSRIDVKEDQPVSQNQTIGAVGMTGWATGPHVHFEFRVNGEYADPAAVAQAGGGQPVSAAARPAFDRVALATRTELASAFSVVQASAE